MPPFSMDTFSHLRDVEAEESLEWRDVLVYGYLFVLNGQDMTEVRWLMRMSVLKTNRG